MADPTWSPLSPGTPPSGAHLGVCLHRHCQPGPRHHPLSLGSKQKPPKWPPRAHSCPQNNPLSAQQPRHFVKITDAVLSPASSALPDFPSCSEENPTPPSAPGPCLPPSLIAYLAKCSCVLCLSRGHVSLSVHTVPGGTCGRRKTPVPRTESPLHCRSTAKAAHFPGYTEFLRGSQRGALYPTP